MFVCSVCLNSRAEARGHLTSPPASLCPQHLLLGRSNIHGWGAFTREEISKNELITEYVGEVIALTGVLKESQAAHWARFQSPDV